MDDRSAHFFTLVGQVCDSAQLARLPVRLVLDDGTVLEGHPTPVRPSAEPPLDDTGYAAIDLDGRHVALSDVVEAAVRRPRDPDAAGEPR